MNGFFPADAFVVGACFCFGGRVAPSGLGSVRDGFGWCGGVMAETVALPGLSPAEALAPGGRVLNCFGGKEGAGLGFQTASALVVTGVSTQG